MTKPGIIVTVDFDDEVVWRKRPLAVDDVTSALTRLKACGVDGVVWRLTCLGQAHYRSAVLPPPAFDEADVREWADWSKRRTGFSPGVTKSIESGIQRREWTAWIRATLDRMDPPEVAGQVCRDLGLKFLLWVDLFDGWFPGTYDPALREQPDRCWTDRSGTKFLRGVQSYAIPENVQRMLAAVREINRYRPDGLYFCLSCHSLHIPEHPDVLAADGFGYEKPVLERFRARHGREPGLITSDRMLLDAIRGEFMTDMFRQVRATLAPAAGLYLPLQMHSSAIKTSSYFDGPIALSYFQDYHRWLDDELAQGLVIGDYEHIFRWATHWKLKGLPNGNEQTVPADHLDELFPGMRWQQCPHYFFSGWISDRASIGERLQRMRNATRKYPAAGSWLHELMNFEIADAWDLLSDHARAH